MTQDSSIHTADEAEAQRVRLKISSSHRHRAFLLFASALLWSISTASAQTPQLPSAPVRPVSSCPVTKPEEILAAAQRKEIAQAEHDFSCYASTHPGDADVAYLRARVYFEEHKAIDALTSYTEAAKLRTPSAADLKFVALSYVLLGSEKDAEHWLQRSIAMDKNDSEAWYALGRVDYGLSRFADAKQAFDRTLELSPRSIKAENNLGLTLEGLGHDDQAEAAYLLATQWQQNQVKQSEQPLLNLGRLRLHRGKVDEALRALREAVAIAPEDPQIHEQLGIAYSELADYHSAEREYRIALAATPGKAALHFQLGRVLQKLSEPKQANEEFETAKKLLGTTSSEHPSS